MNAHQILVLDLFQKLKCLFPYYQHELRLIKQIRVRIKQSTEKWLIDNLSKRLLGLEFKSNHSIKSKCLKWIVKNVLPTIWGINYRQTLYFCFCFFEFTLFSLIFSLTFLTFSFTSSYFCFSLIIALNSPWLISISIHAWDTKVPMLSSLFLANIRILYYALSFCFSLCSVIFQLFLLLEKLK